MNPQTPPQNLNGDGGYTEAELHDMRGRPDTVKDTLFFRLAGNSNATDHDGNLLSPGQIVQRMTQLIVDVGADPLAKNSGRDALSLSFRNHPVQVSEWLAGQVFEYENASGEIAQHRYPVPVDGAQWILSEMAANNDVCPPEIEEKFRFLLRQGLDLTLPPTTATAGSPSIWSLMCEKSPSLVRIALQEPSAVIPYRFQDPSRDHKTGLHVACHTSKYLTAYALMKADVEALGLSDDQGERPLDALFKQALYAPQENKKKKAAEFLMGSLKELMVAVDMGNVSRSAAIDMVTPAPENGSPLRRDDSLYHKSLLLPDAKMATLVVAWLMSLGAPTHYEAVETTGMGITSMSSHSSLIQLWLRHHLKISRDMGGSWAPTMTRLFNLEPDMETSDIAEALLSRFEELSGKHPVPWGAAVAPPTATGLEDTGSFLPPPEFLLLENPMWERALQKRVDDGTINPWVFSWGDSDTEKRSVFGKTYVERSPTPLITAALVREGLNAGFIVNNDGNPISSHADYWLSWLHRQAEDSQSDPTLTATMILQKVLPEVAATGWFEGVSSVLDTMEALVDRGASLEALSASATMSLSSSFVLGARRAVGKEQEPGNASMTDLAKRAFNLVSSHAPADLWDRLPAADRPRVGDTSLISAVAWAGVLSQPTVAEVNEYQNAKSQRQGSKAQPPLLPLFPLSVVSTHAQDDGGIFVEKRFPTDWLMTLGADPWARSTPDEILSKLPRTTAKGADDMGLLTDWLGGLRAHEPINGVALMMLKALEIGPTTADGGLLIRSMEGIAEACLSSSTDRFADILPTMGQVISEAQRPWSSEELGAQSMLMHPWVSLLTREDGGHKGRVYLAALARHHMQSVLDRVPDQWSSDDPEPLISTLSDTRNVLSSWLAWKGPLPNSAPEAMEESYQHLLNLILTLGWRATIEVSSLSEAVEQKEVVASAVARSLNGMTSTFWAAALRDVSTDGVNRLKKHLDSTITEMADVLSDRESSLEAEAQRVLHQKTPASPEDVAEFEADMAEQRRVVAGLYAWLDGVRPLSLAMDDASPSIPSMGSVRVSRH